MFGLPRSLPQVSPASCLPEEVAQSPRAWTGIKGRRPYGSGLETNTVTAPLDFPKATDFCVCLGEFLLSVSQIPFLPRNPLSSQGKFLEPNAHSTTQPQHVPWATCK